MNDRNRHHSASNKPTPIKMAKYAFPYLAVIGLLFNLNIYAQTSKSRYMAGLSATFMDYQGNLTGNFVQYKTFDPGISFGAHAYLNKLMNVSLISSFVPEATYPIARDQFTGTSLIDVSTMAQFKSNGTFMDETASVAPYLVTGFGLNSASNNVRFYVPAGLGVRFQLSENFNFQLQSVYKVALGKNKFQHVAHSAGFVFALPSNPYKEQKPIKETQEEVPAIVQVPIDTDNDGVADRDDFCPEEKGPAAFLGCPEDPNAPKEEIADNTLELEQGNEMVDIQQMKDPIEPQHLNAFSDAKPVHQKITKEDLAKLENAMDNIYFEKASDQLTPESLTVLDQVAGLLKKYPQYDLQVLGHTDNTGGQNNNLVLSIKRAFNVKYYLVYDKGVRLSRITSDGYSSVAPLGDNTTVSGRAKNRRVELKLIESDKNKVGYQSN